MRKNKISINPSIKGIVTLYMTDIRTKERKVIQKNNLILNDYINRFFTRGTQLVNIDSSDKCTMYECFLGTSNVETSAEQTGVQGTTLASTSDKTILAQHVIDDGKIINSGMFTFPGGVGTGEVGEILLRTGNSKLTLDGGYGYSNNWVARIIYNPKIEKTEYIQLDIEWEIQVNFGTSIYETYLSNGQKDGSPVTCKAYINDQHKLGISNPTTSDYLGGGFVEIYKDPDSLDPGGFRMLVGDSNDPSDIENDSGWELKGNTLADITNREHRTLIPYESGSRERGIRLDFFTDTINEPIGEVVIGTDVTNGAVMRITFDPPLDKVDTHRLYITPTFKLTTGGA